MKKIIFSTILIALVTSFIVVWHTQSIVIARNMRGIDESVYNRARVEIKGIAFDAFVADTDSLRSRGLGGFAGLKAGEAMLFVFDTLDTWSFWMKDMLFPIDIVWINAQSRIVFLKTNVSPDTFPKSFTPKDSALYVLELPAGTVNRFWFNVGDQVSIVR